MNDKKLHYYGDLVRKLFLGAAIFMLLTLPFMSDYIELPLYISVIAAIGVGIFAGITNPKQTWTAHLNFVISLVGVAIFEYYAVEGYNDYSFRSRVFLVNQILAIVFFVALYYSTKTLRGMLIK